MMATFIAKQIIKRANISLEEGQKLYKAYIVNTHIYAKWQPDVNAILETEGYADCIVEE